MTSPRPEQPDTARVINLRLTTCGWLPHPPHRFDRSKPWAGSAGVVETLDPHVIAAAVQVSFTRTNTADGVGGSAA